MLFTGVSAAAHVIVVVMSLYKIRCFKKKATTNNCGIFDLLQDLSMNALQNAAKKNQEKNSGENLHYKF